VATVTITSKLLNISLGTFLTSLGAAAALLTFLFKDTVLGMLASLQLISQDIIRIGDTISVSQFNIDGKVENITINMVKIRNSDKSISTIPTSSLLSTNVVNWRGVEESVAKKIQRSIYIDINSIIFIPNSFLDILKKSPYLSKDLINKIIIGENDDDNLTNIKLFRLYATEYLKSNPAIYKQDFTFLVRQLASGPEGLPIELYVFTDKILDREYEEVQAEIFDHLFAVLTEFKLRIYQNSSTRL
jgi:miniconductance mechanosensitive channel